MGLFVILTGFLVTWFFSYLYWQLITYLYFRSAGLPVGSTEKLRKLWPKIVGFRLLIKTVEWEKLKADPNLAHKALPYCIAFGLTVDPKYKL